MALVLLAAAILVLFATLPWLGRRDEQSRSRKLKPWTQRMGPLIAVRPWIRPYGWALTTVGLSGLPLAFVDDHVDSTISGSVVVAVAGFLIDRHWTFPPLAAAVPVPTGATVGPSKGRVTYWALTAGVLLVLLVPVAVVDAVLRDGDVGLVVTLCAYYLGMGISSLIRGGEIAGWENEHRVEFLRARWRRGPQELYVRARVMPNSTSLADA